MLIPEDFCQVNLIFGGTGLPQGGQVVFGVHPTDPVAWSVQSVATDVLNAWNTSGIKAELASSTTMTGILVKAGPNATGASGLFAGAGANTNAGVGAAPNTTYLVGKNTDAGGRSGRGRMFLPGVPEVNVNEAGVVSPAAVTALQTKVSAFLTALLTNDTPMVLLHGGPSAPITTPLDVTSLSVSNVVATQRRRLRR